MPINHLFPESPNSLKLNGNTSHPAADFRQKPLPIHPTNGTRSSPVERVGSPPVPDAESPASVRFAQSNHVSNGDSSPVWSSAVGRATTGKSGRVIERLMNENDRLVREQKLATVKLEEETKRSESARLALESLQVSNENLSTMHESDGALLLKRDRKIQDLKDELKLETTRREVAEEGARVTRRERDDLVDLVRREALEDKEVSRRATNQYDTLSKSWRSLEERYERQASHLKNMIGSIQTELGQDRVKIVRLEVIIEQLRREEEKTKQAKDKLMSQFDAYRLESEQSLETIRTTSRGNASTNEEAQRQLLEVLGQMRHAIGVQAAFAASAGKGSSTVSK